MTEVMHGAATFCQKCGKDTPDDAKFCPHCGAQSSAVVRAPALLPEKPGIGERIVTFILFLIILGVIGGGVLWGIGK